MLHYPMAFSGALDLIMGMRGRDRRAVTMVGLSGTSLTDNMVREVTERILMLPDKPTSQLPEKLELLRVRPLNLSLLLWLAQRLMPLAADGDIVSDAGRAARGVRIPTSGAPCDDRSSTRNGLLPNGTAMILGEPSLLPSLFLPPSPRPCDGRSGAPNLEACSPLGRVCINSNGVLNHTGRARGRAGAGPGRARGRAGRGAGRARGRAQGAGPGGRGAGRRARGRTGAGPGRVRGRAGPEAGTGAGPGRAGRAV